MLPAEPETKAVFTTMDENDLAEAETLRVEDGQLPECPTCGALLPQGHGAETVECERCGETVPAGESEIDATLTQFTPGPDSSESVPGVVMCPECGRDVEMPDDGGAGRCQWCGKTVSPAAQADSRSLAEAETIAEPPPSETLEQGRTGERAAAETMTQAVDESASATDETRPPGAAGKQWLQERLGDRYEILDFVGRGGMGTVYRARQHHPSRIVALKIMRGGALSSSRARKRFEREAEAAARIRHPAIVPVYEVGEVDGQPFYTMAFVEGTDLQKYVFENNPGRKDICRLLVQVCNAVDAAHRHGIIHRDLKPGNIMVNENGQVQILDFGLARMVRTDEGEHSLLTMSGDILGTPRYMSPEQAMGKPDEVDARADVYSLGVILYELVVGMPPYNIEGIQGIRALEVVKEAEPVRPSLIHPLLSRDLEAILLKALEKEKSNRYRTADSLGDDLENYIADRPVSAQPATRMYRLRKLLWRNRRIVFPLIAFLFVLGLVGGVLGGMWWGARREMRSMAERLEEYAGGVQNIPDYVISQTEAGNWQLAASNARFAQDTWPDEVVVQGLVSEVRKRAARTVDERVASLQTCIRDQRYQKGRQLAGELQTLAERLPFDDIANLAREKGGSFERLCWQDLQKVLLEAHVYRRGETVDFLRNYLEAFGDVAHAEEAQDLLAKYREAPDRVYAERHLQAAEREIQAGGWETALAILGNLHAFLPAANLKEPSRWEERMVELRRDIQTTIWTGTVTELEVQRELSGHEQFIKSLKFQPASRSLRLASGATDNTVRLWDPRQGKELGNLKCSDNVRCISFAPDGQTLAAACSDDTVHIWNLSEGEEVRSWKAGHEYRLLSVQHTPEGDFLVTGSADSVRLWDLRPESPGLVAVYENARSPVTLARTGARVISSTHQGDIGIWDLRSAAQERIINVPFAPNALALSPNEQMLAFGGTEGEISMWDLEMDQGVEWPTNHEAAVQALSFSPDGQIVASAGRDAAILLWDVRGVSEPVRLLRRLNRHKHWIFDVCFSPDGKLLVSGGNGRKVLVWAVEAGDASR